MPDHPEVARLNTKPRLDDIVVLLLVVVVVLFYFVAQGTYALLVFANYGLIAFVGICGSAWIDEFHSIGQILAGFSVSGLRCWLDSMDARSCGIQLHVSDRRC